MVSEALKAGVVGQAVTRGEIVVKTINPRDFVSDIHKTVDDRPFGGGDGMVMLSEPLTTAMAAISAGEAGAGHRVYLSAQGRVWKDSIAREWSQKHKVITLICGRYGGIDQRFLNAHVDEEISVGDYILSGGELAALVLIDTLARLQPGVLGNAQSKDLESPRHKED
jgi:tRNA (guanine37-N1)-methyltransferase